MLRELDAEAREWADRLTHTGVAETGFEDPEMLAEQARLMDFVQPHPGQRESIPWQQLTYPEDANFAVAQLDGQSQPDPAASESVTDQAGYVDGPAIVPVAEPAAVQVPVETPIPSAVEVAPVVAEVPPTAPITPELPTESVLSDAPTTVVTNVVLDLPEEAYVEDLTVLETEMESLESL